jgi:hypothetical protein
VTVPVVAPSIVPVADLRVGDLLAEGGEGLVHQLPRQPHLVYKAYRDRADRSYLDDLVSWPEMLPTPGLVSTVRTASAWPCSVVTDRDGRAGGLLMPRTPRRFSVRHRDGHSRLASLSYLTTEPEHRAIAYGLSLPAPAGPERIGLVYALARLLAAFEAGRPSVSHGDLSTKNVLWSLQRGPEVFVIDCDNSDLFDPDGRPAHSSVRRRAMTPNWDDPAVSRGQNPSSTTDRYSLALVFLRVVGAANFPIQARQRSGEPVEVRFPVPPGPSAASLLDPNAPVWRLCARSLTLSGHAERPPAAAWLLPLESLLHHAGAESVVSTVRAAQVGREGQAGERGATGNGASPGDRASMGDGVAVRDRALAGPEPDDIRIIPVPVAGRPRVWAHTGTSARSGGDRASSATAPIGYRTAVPAFTTAGGRARRGAGVGPTWVRPTGHPAMAPGSQATSPAGPRVWPEIKAELRRFLGWWVAIHRSLFTAVGSPSRTPRRARTVLLCAVVDLAILVLGGAAVAVIVAPLAQG